MSPPQEWPHFQVATGEKRLWIETESSQLSLEFMEAAQLLVRYFNVFRARVPTASWTIDRAGESGGYSYEFRAEDGRQWKQTLYFDLEDWQKEPMMTFDVNHRWALSEFEPHRDIRDIVVKMIQKYGLRSLSWEDM